MILAGLSSLRPKKCQISVKIWIFKDPILKNAPFLFILVPGRDKIIQIRKLFEKKKAFEVIEAVEVFEAANVIEAAEVSEARKIISEVFRINQVIELNNFYFYVLKKIMLEES